MSSRSKGKTPESDTSKPSGRVGKPKVRTGCITCKLRRIKCDEGKPFCGRCTSTGRRCDGYALKRHGSQIGSRARATAFPPVSVIIKFVYPSTVPHLPLSYPGGTPEELRSLEFFRNNTASKLSKWMTGSFWKVQLPQTGFYEPSIRHSMIAIASIHEEMERISEPCIPDPMCYASSEARQHYAAQHAQMAMSELSKLLAARPEATEVALINCILFVMLDFMAGKFATALLHLHNGLEIMRKWRNERLGFEDFRPGSLEDNLTQVLHQLSFRTSYDDNDQYTHLEIDDHKHHAFADLSIAKRTMEFLMREGLRVVRVGTVLALTRQGSDAKSEIGSEVSLQYRRLSRWSTRFEALADNMHELLGYRDEEAIHELRVMHMTAMIWLEIGVSFDRPDSSRNFESVIDRSEDLHVKRCTHSHESLSAHCVLEEGFLPPIYFLATRRPDLEVGTRGVALLVMSTPKVQVDHHDSLNGPIRRMLKLEEEKLDPDGRRTLEIEVQPTTQQMALNFIPRGDGGVWEIDMESSMPPRKSTTEF